METKKQSNQLMNNFYSPQQNLHQEFSNQNKANDTYFSEMQRNFNRFFQNLKTSNSNQKSQSFQTSIQSFRHQTKSSIQNLQSSQHQTKSSIQNLQSSQGQIQSSIKHLQRSQDQMKSFIENLFRSYQNSVQKDINDKIVNLQNNMNQRFQKTENKITTLQRKLDNHVQILDKIERSQNKMSREVTSLCQYVGQMHKTTSQLRIASETYKMNFMIIRQSFQSLTHRASQIQINSNKMINLIEKLPSAVKFKNEQKFLDSLMRIQNTLAQKNQGKRTELSNVDGDIAKLQIFFIQTMNSNQQLAQKIESVQFSYNEMNEKIKRLEAKIQALEKNHLLIQQDLEILSQPK